MSSVYRNEKQAEYLEKNEELSDKMPEFVKDYCIARERRISALTQNVYLQRLYRFLSYLVETKPSLKGKDVRDITFEDLDALTAEDVDRFIHHVYSGILDMRKKQNGSEATSVAARANKTTNNYISALNSFFKYLYERGRIKENVVTKVERSRRKDIDKPFLDDEEDQERFLHSARGSSGLSKHALSYRKNGKIPMRDYMICLTFLKTGLRVSELVSLNLSDVDFKEHCFHTVRKGDKDVAVFFDDEYESELKEYFEMRDSEAEKKSEPLFAVNIGKYAGKRLSVRSVQRLVKKYAESAGVKEASRISPHRLRASFASNLLEATHRNLYLVQQRMAHESPATTEIYLRKDVDIADSRNALAYRNEADDGRKE